MGVHIKPDGRWFIQYAVEGTKKRKREYFGRGPLAEAAAREAFSKLNIRASPVPGVPTFEELVVAYMEDRQESLSDSTLEGMVPKINAIYLPELGDLSAVQVDEYRLSEYIKKRCRVVKRTTVHRELCDIRAIMNWAVKKKIISRNPMAGLTFPKKDDESIRPPSADEIRRILAHSPAHLKRALIISWYIGLRVGEELLSRKWHDVDWDNQLFYVVSAQKGGLDTRRVPIATDIYPRLLQWYIEDQAALEESAKKRKKKFKPDQIRALADDLYIIRWHGKRVLKIKTAWAKAKKKAGIHRRLRPYDLRHAFVTDLLDSGADLKTVGDLAGHKDKSTTAYVYNHVTDERSRRVVEKRKSILE